MDLLTLSMLLEIYTANPVEAEKIFYVTIRTANQTPRFPKELADLC